MVQRTSASDSLASILAQPALKERLLVGQIGLLREIQPLASQLATACSTLQATLNRPELRPLYETYQQQAPLCMPSNAGQIVSENPLSATAAGLSEHINTLLAAAESSPTRYKSVPSFQLENFRMIMQKMGRFVDPSLRLFHQELTESVIPSLEKSIDLGDGNRNRFLLGEARTLATQIEQLTPTLDALQSTCNQFMQTLPESRSKGHSFA